MIFVEIQFSWRAQSSRQLQWHGIWSMELNGLVCRHPVHYSRRTRSNRWITKTETLSFLFDIASSGRPTDMARMRGWDQVSACDLTNKSPCDILQQIEWVAGIQLLHHLRVGREREEKSLETLNTTTDLIDLIHSRLLTDRSVVFNGNDSHLTIVRVVGLQERKEGRR